jgi:type III pantothenate kinase
MQLLVDIGNTSIKWATWNGHALARPGSAKHFGALPIDLLAAWDALDDISGIVVARVGPQSVLDAVAKIASARWRCKPSTIATSAQAHGVRIAYSDPARLGVDRFLALIGAHALHAGPKLIVDAGTAVTYDLLLADGSHLGGLILPGIALMRDSVLAGTQIPRYEPAEADQSWAADTAVAVAAASIQAPAALAERLYQRLSDLTGQAPKLIITGGDAERLLPAIALPTIHHPELVLLGLTHYTHP